MTTSGDWEKKPRSSRVAFTLALAAALTLSSAVVLAFGDKTQHLVPQSDVSGPEDDSWSGREGNFSLVRIEYRVGSATTLRFHEDAFTEVPPGEYHVDHAARTLTLDPRTPAPSPWTAAYLVTDGTGRERLLLDVNQSRHTALVSLDRGNGSEPALSVWFTPVPEHVLVNVPPLLIPGYEPLPEGMDECRTSWLHNSREDAEPANATGEAHGVVRAWHVFKGDSLGIRFHASEPHCPDLRLDVTYIGLWERQAPSPS